MPELTAQKAKSLTSNRSKPTVTSEAVESVSVPSEKPEQPEPSPQSPAFPTEVDQAAEFVQKILKRTKILRAFRRSLVDANLRQFAELGSLRLKIEAAVDRELADPTRLRHWVMLARMLKPGAPAEHVARLMGLCIGYGVIRDMMK